MPALDTHEAAKASCHVGFDHAQAKAAVEKINEAVNENVAPRIDLDRFATKRDFDRLITKEDLKGFELRFNARLDQLAKTTRWSLLGVAISCVALMKVLDAIVG